MLNRESLGVPVELEPGFRRLVAGNENDSLQWHRTQNESVRQGC